MRTFTGPLRVGDVVRVARRSGVNEPHARAVVVDVYERGSGSEGWFLLFEDGRYDGFSPDDCALFGVTPIGHAPSVANYQFRNVIRLDDDWCAGRFDAAFPKDVA